jgi:hypothetical protein
MAITMSSAVIMPRSPWLASAGMHEERGRAGRGERGGDLVAHVTRLAHAGHDDRAARGEDQAVRGQEGLAQARLQPADGVGLDVEHAARELEQLRLGPCVRL